jgi:hypothetical protein
VFKPDDRGPDTLPEAMIDGDPATASSNDHHVQIVQDAR